MKGTEVILDENLRFTMFCVDHQISYYQALTLPTWFIRNIRDINVAKSRAGTDSRSKKELETQLGIAQKNVRG